MTMSLPERDRSTWRRLVAVVLLGVWATLAAPVMAADEDAPGEAQLAIREQVTKIRNQLKNARARMANGVVGMSQDKTASEAPATPAAACCSVNLSKIGAAVEALDGIVGALGDCYAKGMKTDARAAGQFAAGDLAMFGDAVRQWSETTDQRTAEGQLGALVKPFNTMHEALEALPECPGALLKKQEKPKDGKS